MKNYHLLNPNIKLALLIIFSIEVSLAILFLISKSVFLIFALGLIGIFVVLYFSFYQILLFTTFIIIALYAHSSDTVFPLPPFHNYSRLMVIIAILLMLWLVRSFLSGKFILLKDKLSLPLFIFLLICAGGVFNGIRNGNKLYLIKYDIIIFFLYGFYFIFRPQLKKKKQVKQLIYVIILATLFASFLYIATLMLGSYTQSESGRIINRQVHFFMVSSLFLVSYIIFSEKGWQKIAALAALFPIIIATIISQTRGTWASTLLGMLIIIIIGIIKRKLKISFVLKLIPLILIAIIILTYFLGFVGQTKNFDIQEKLAERTSTISNLREDMSAIMRYILYYLALKRFEKSPFIGRGFGDVIIAPAIFYGTAFHLSWVDSTWISLLWKLGIIGTLSYIWLFAVVFMRILDIYRYGKDEISQIFSIGMIALMVSFAAISLISPVLLKYRFNLVWVFLFAATDFLATQSKSKTTLTE